MGSTDVSVLSQPEIRGNLHKDSSGEFPDLPLPSELVIETEDAATSGGIAAIFTTSYAMADILSDINSALTPYAEAEEYEGCVVVRTVGTGDGAYVRILAPISGFDDAAPVLGLPIHPNPTATVSSGDFQDAPTRPLQQANPVGTKYLATGEDRVASSFNRALHVLGKNADTLHKWLRRPIATAIDVLVDETTWAAYIDTDSDGSIDQIDLSGVVAFDSSQDGRFFVGGGLDRNSTLDAIAEFWGVLDSDHKEMMAGDRIVRIGCVTRGQRGAIRPSFNDDTTPPLLPLADTSGVSVDGENALGVDREKHAAVSITEVRQNTLVYCSGATFETNGVVAGDLATISGAAVDVPFNHNGTYLVETVVSEEELILRPHHDNDHVRELNPDDSASLGSVTISSGGEWESSLWVTFEPALPRFPADGKIRLILPIEYALGDTPVDARAAAKLRTAEEVDGWVLFNLWRQLNFGGVYQGMNHALGGGYRGDVTHRPITLVNKRAEAQATGSTSRSSTVAATLHTDTLWLEAGADDSFTPDDVGKTITLTGPYLDDEPWTIVRFIDGMNVELGPPIMRSGFGESASSSETITSWTILDDDVIELQSMLQLVSPEYFGESDTAASRLGYAYVREQRDESAVTSPVPGALSFLHLEKLRLVEPAGANKTVFVSPSINGNTIELDFDPEQTANIFAAVGDTKTFALSGGITYVRILHGDNAGVYMVHQLTSSAGVGTDTLKVLNIDGSTPTFASETDISCSLYNAKFAVGAPVFQGPQASAGGFMTAALSLFEDAHETGASFGASLRVGWRGVGGGILAYVNDPEFIAHGNGDAADGNVFRGVLYAPALGFFVTVEGDSSGDDDSRPAYAWKSESFGHRAYYGYDSPGPAGFNFTNIDAFGAMLSQTGKDPGTIVVKQLNQTTSTAPTFAYSKFTPSAAFLLGHAGGQIGGGDSYADGQVGRGSAGEQRGSFWVYCDDQDYNTGAAGWPGGGVYVEDVLASRWCYPMFGTYDSDSYPYTGTSPYTGWSAGATLGMPGRLLPVDFAAASGNPEADFDAPDYTVFNIPHSAVAVIDLTGDPVPEKPWTKWIGQRLVVVEPGHDLLDLDMVIVAARQTDQNELTLALHREGTTYASSSSDSEFQVFGQRWWESTIDIASYMHVGTRIERDKELLPLVTLGAGPDEAVQRIDPEDTATLGVGTGGLMSIPPWIPTTYGAGIGIVQALASMSNVDGVTPVAYTHEWRVNSSLGADYVRHGWAQDNEEPRTPFPNAGVVVNDNMEDGYWNNRSALSADYPGSLVSGEFALEHVTQNSVYGAIAVFNEDYGGVLRIRSHPDNGGSANDSIRLWQRGLVGFNERAYSLKARFLVHRTSGSVDVTFALRKDDGTAIESEAETVTPGDNVAEYEYTWTNYDLDAHTADAFDASREPASGVHLTLDMDVTEGDTLTLQILEMRVENLARPVRLHHGVDVSGAVRAASYRYFSPVPGYQTVGPAEVSFLNGDPWAKAAGSSDADSLSTEYTYGVHEGKSLGYIMSSGGVWYKPAYDASQCFRQDEYSASVRLNHPFFDPFWYVYRIDTEHGSAALATNGIMAYTVLPGRVGFLVPLRPPHGSMLASLAWNLSFFPAHDEVSPANSHWGVFREYPTTAAFSTGFPNALTDWEDLTAWEPQSGVRVGLWRYNCLDTGFSAGDNYPGSYVVESGMPERILLYEVDLSGITPPSRTANTADATAQAGAGDSYSYEYHVHSGVDVQAEVENEGEDRQLLFVDRRHYAYFVTIDFFGGPRCISDTDDFYYLTDSQYVDTYMASGVVLGGATEPYVRAPYPLDKSQYWVWPPAVKYRGLRLGWVTNRSGSGGWG